MDMHVADPRCNSAMLGKQITYDKVTSTSDYTCRPNRTYTHIYSMLYFYTQNEKEMKCLLVLALNSVRLCSSLVYYGTCTFEIVSRQIIATHWFLQIPHDIRPWPTRVGGLQDVEWYTTPHNELVIFVIRKSCSGWMIYSTVLIEQDV